MREHIEAIRSKVRDLRVEDGLIGYDDRLTVLLDAAIAEAERVEADYQRAREAFIRLRRQPRQSTLDVVCDLDDLDAFFNPSGEAENA